MKGLNLRQLIVLLILSFTLVTILPAKLLATEEYRFERMWPVLEQPWYFTGPNAIAIDGAGNVYVADPGGDRILKFTSSGKFITKWGSYGSDDGQFSYTLRGIGIDHEENVYVVDDFRIQKFSSSGAFITKWGSEGSGDGEFNGPRGIAIDRQGNVYVTDCFNERIQKFSSSGTFITKWGAEGDGDGEFSFPNSIAVDEEGNVYVTDGGNYRIQKFSPSGEFITKWGAEGVGDGEFSYPRSIAVDDEGNVYVADGGGMAGENNRIQKFSSSGKFITKWGAEGDSDGEFRDPIGITADRQGNIYVADRWNDRIQKFTSLGIFITKWVSSGNGDGEFRLPNDVAVDVEGNIYVLDYGNWRIQKFNSSGKFITKWGNWGEGAGEFIQPESIAVDDEGNVYVTDGGGNYRIQKLSPSGVFITEWGGLNGPGGLALDRQGNVYVADSGNNCIKKFSSSGVFITEWGGLNYPNDIAVDGKGNVYVVDESNPCIHKFSASGKFIAEWGSEGSGDGQFKYRTGNMGIAVDDAGNVYVVDGGNNRIQKFNPSGAFITKFGNSGSEPGLLHGPKGIVSDPNGKIYVSDYLNNRIQVFKEATTGSNNKAIILAGGGAYSGNDLWDVTQMCANFAYRTLTYQGFTKESIYYLTSDTDLDLDSNGVLDDVDGDATNSNLQQAITSWAADADGVLIYMVDHGGTGTFRMSGTETFTAEDLSNWLNTLQTTMAGKITMIYEACKSGSFLQKLTAPVGRERILITSTSPSESAKYLTQGSISFSNYFWSDIFNGRSIRDAFQGTQQALKTYFDDQNPLLDANGNGVGNEAEDFELAENTYIGNGTVISGDAPTIGSVSPAQTISGKNSADLFAASVTDSDGISRVWAVIRTPDYVQEDSDNPVLSLPSIDLMPVGNNRYEGTFGEFDTAGTYQIAIYAMDRIGNTGIPQLTTVSVENPLKRRAVIVAAGPSSSLLWPTIESNAKAAHEALCFQGYANDDIYFLSPVTFSTGVDGTPTLSNLTYALTTWAATNTQDLVLYMIGSGENEMFHLNETETLSATDLDFWLDDLQGSIPGKVTVIYEAGFSGSFLPILTPPDGKRRISISSASFSEAGYFVSEENVCFSKYFWARIANGANVRDSFLHGKRAMEHVGYGQVPQLDDTGNGIGNEKDDGHVAGNYTLGAGIILGGDDPIIGSVSPSQALTDSPSATIWADNVTSTGTIDKVWAVITPPDYSSASSVDPITDLPTIDLAPVGNNRYESTYTNFTSDGTYNIAIIAVDTEGTLSLPVQTTVTVTGGNGCLSVAGDLSIWVPCAEYNGAQYGFNFNFYSNPDDASGFYWKLDMPTLKGGAGTDCIPIASDLSMPMDCVSYNGRQYGFMLKFYSNPDDPSGLYWKMDMSTLEVK